MSEETHCPICKKTIALPFWLVSQYGNLYIAYCYHCERAYQPHEVLWIAPAPSVDKDERDTVERGA